MQILEVVATRNVKLISAKARKRVSRQLNLAVSEPVLRGRLNTEKDGNCNMIPVEFLERENG